MPSFRQGWTTLVRLTCHFVLLASVLSFSQRTSIVRLSPPPAGRALELGTFMVAPGDFFDEISENIEGDGEGNEESGFMSEEELKASMGEWDPRVPKLNTVTLVGRVGNDPDPRYFDDGKVVLNLSLAVKRKYHPLERRARNIISGEEETDWFGLEIWGRDAEFAAKYVDKGARIGVTGSLQVDQWTDKVTGEPREKAKIIVKHLDILESRAEAEMRREGRRGPSFYTKNEDDDDDISPAGTGGFFD